MFVSIFGAALGPMFGIMIADYYLMKKEHVILEDLYTMDPKGSLYFEGGCNRKALVALAVSGVIAIGLALLGAWKYIPNVGDWGWLVGAVLGGAIHDRLMIRKPAFAAQPVE